MRERAAELGGRCSITERAKGGLVVRVVVPLEHPQAEDSDMEGDA